MIEITKYYPHPDTDLQGNPLIEYHPHFSRDALRQAMTSAFEFDPADTTHDWELRMNYPLRLLDIFLPLDNQLDWAMRFVGLMNSNLKRRNPLRKSAAQSFHERCEAVAHGRSIKGSDASPLNSPMCSVLLGTPGTGKTTTALALLDVLGPELLWHKNHGALYQQLYLHVEAPTSGSNKSLALVVFLALRDKAAETGHKAPYMARVPDSTAALEVAIEKLAKALNLGVLLLDEMQHLYRGSNGIDKVTMTFLTGVINRLGVVVLMVGTWEAAGLMTLEARLGRRGTNSGKAFFYRMREGEAWDAMVSYFLQYQYTERRIEFTPELSERLYHHCQGIQDILVKLFLMCQMEAISSGEEELTLALIDRVAQEQLEFIAPAIRRLRGDALENDPTLWDVEPQDFTSYIHALNASMTLRGARNRKHIVSVNEKVQKALQVKSTLLAAGSSSEGVAQALAESAVEKSPQRSVEDLVSNIFAASKPKGPKPSRSEKKKAQVDEQFDKLDDDDLRKIVYLATRANTSVLEALDAKGFICRPVEELAI